MKDINTFNLKYDLDAYRKKNLYRHRRVVSSPQGAEIVVDGRPLIAFCNNDYLGLANHPSIAEAILRALKKYGVGAGASHLVTGHSQAHHELEEALAQFTRRDRALLFSTGYMANMGVISALLNKQDAIFEDRLNHASLIDAGLMSNARFYRYFHKDIQDLNRKIQATTARRKLIVTDGVFSMDGDLAPVLELVNVAKQQSAQLMIDDAHGFGVLGKNGGGITEMYKMGQSDVPILMGTLGKAFGISGAFLAGSHDLIETLVQFARPYIYTTAIPPALAEAAKVSLQLATKETWRREKLGNLIRYFRNGCTERGISTMDSNTPIQPIVIGSPDQVLLISQKMEQSGILITPIRPPTVANNTSRLRITLNIHHNNKLIDKLLDTLNNVLSELKSPNRSNLCSLL